MVHVTKVTPIQMRLTGPVLWAYCTVRVVAA
jgi:hypothetical protein